jgi:uncharacterized protein
VADDLGKPLGPKRGARTKQSWRFPLVPLLALTLGGALTTAAVWIAVVDDPLGGEPRAVSKINTPETTAGKNPSPAAATTKQAVAPDAAKSGGQTVTIIDGKSGAKREVMLTPGKDSNDAPTSSTPLDPRLAENSRHGTIPRIGPDGARPMEVFAKSSAAASSMERKGARIAIIIGGLGIGATATGEALAKLPPVVTLAFAPYGAELSKWVTRARGAGHEILLQLPMEPFDYPDNDPGPQTLLSSISAEQNIDRLHWFMSRFQGYIGVTNFMGARFTSNDAAFAPVLRDIGKRGLLYVDDGASQRSLAPKILTEAKLPFLKADVVLDARPTWQEIDQALDRLEKIANEQGHAIGTAGALPVSIERIARWAKAAGDRGVIVVPVSAIVARQKQS